MELAPEWQSDDLYEGNNACFPSETITMVASEWKSHKGVRDLRNTSTREHFIECEVISPLHFRQQAEVKTSSDDHGMPVSEYRVPGYVRNACSKYSVYKLRSGYLEHRVPQVQPATSRSPCTRVPGISITIGINTGYPGGYPVPGYPGYLSVTSKCTPGTGTRVPDQRGALYPGRMIVVALWKESLLLLLLLMSFWGCKPGRRSKTTPGTRYPR
eukprot:2410109-Rhodomonas_salina.1